MKVASPTATSVHRFLVHVPSPIRRTCMPYRKPCTTYSCQALSCIVLLMTPRTATATATKSDLSRARDRRARVDRDGHRRPRRGDDPPDRAGVRGDPDGALLARRQQGRAPRRDGRRPARRRDAAARDRVLVHPAARGRRGARSSELAQAPRGGRAGLPPDPGDRAGAAADGVHAGPARGRRLHPRAGRRPGPDGPADRDDAGHPAARAPRTRPRATSATPCSPRSGPTSRACPRTSIPTSGPRPMP